MTAAVPNPRFRDQLADVLAHHAFSHVNVDGWTVCLCGHVAEGDDDDGSHARHQANVIAAEVEARVQAAANQRAVEELRERAALIRIRAAGEEIEGRQDAADALDEVSSWLLARAAALTSLAPAPHAEGSTDTHPAPAHAHGAAQGADDGV